jgi:hypothetical protein
MSIALAISDSRKARLAGLRYPNHTESSDQAACSNRTTTIFPAGSSSPRPCSARNSAAWSQG